MYQIQKIEGSQITAPFHPGNPKCAYCRGDYPVDKVRFAVYLNNGGQINPVCPVCLGEHILEHPQEIKKIENIGEWKKVVESSISQFPFKIDLEPLLKEMYIRVIIKVGNSLSLTLPFEWVSKTQLSPKSRIYFYFFNNDSILCSVNFYKKYYDFLFQRNIFRLGNSLAVALPKIIVARSKLKKGSKIMFFSIDERNAIILLSINNLDLKLENSLLNSIETTRNNKDFKED